MPLFESATIRFEDIANYIERNLKTANAHSLIRNWIARLDGGISNDVKNALLDRALSLGRTDTNAQETERRLALRTLIFLRIVVAHHSRSLVEPMVAQYGNYTIQQLNAEIQKNLPLFDNSPFRKTWAPDNFSAAQNPPPQSFKYIVMGLPNEVLNAGVSYLTLLKNPLMIQSFLISASIISEKKCSTYYPYGFILKVPEENILSTSSKDQALKNYNKQDDVNPLTPIQLNDSLAEVRRVSGLAPIKTPDQILEGTSGTGGMYGYNEIALMGRSPVGTVVTVQSLFMKVDKKGKRWVRPEAKTNPTPYVTDSIYTVMQNTGHTIVSIIDNKGLNVY